MEGPKITKEKVKTVLDKGFIRVFDLQYEEGRHYYDATRRPLEELVSVKNEKEFAKWVRWRRTEEMACENQKR